MPDFAEQDGRRADFQPLTSAEIDDLVALLAVWRPWTVRHATVRHRTLSQMDNWYAETHATANPAS